jgi:hypothetical protein
MTKAYWKRECRSANLSELHYMGQLEIEKQPRRTSVIMRDFPIPGL